VLPKKESLSLVLKLDFAKVFDSPWGLHGMCFYCIELWRVQYIGVGRPRRWRRLGGNPRAASSGVLAPQTVPMEWAKYSRRRWPDTPVTNTGWRAVGDGRWHNRDSRLGQEAWRNYRGG
jgi:hypothetical protein